MQYRVNTCAGQAGEAAGLYSTPTSFLRAILACPHSPRWTAKRAQKSPPSGHGWRASTSALRRSAGRRPQLDRRRRSERAWFEHVPWLILYCAFWLGWHWWRGFDPALPELPPHVIRDETLPLRVAPPPANVRCCMGPVMRDARWHFVTLYFIMVTPIRCTVCSTCLASAPSGDVR